MTNVTLTPDAASIVELSIRASKTLAGLVSMCSYPQTVEYTDPLPLARLLVRVTMRFPGSEVRAQARELLTSKGPAALALVLTEVSNHAAPAVRGYYSHEDEVLPREWSGHLAITAGGEVLVVGPGGTAIVLAAGGIGHVEHPFMDEVEECEAFDRAARLWHVIVTGTVPEAA